MRIIASSPVVGIGRSNDAAGSCGQANRIVTGR